MEINPNEAPPGAMNKIILGSVVPRPIAWVSSIDAAGRPNLAPFSFFNAVCSRPPTLLFCPGVRGLDGGTKDTYQNILATKEFVINVVTEGLAEAMNISATEFPPEMDEFKLAGLTAAPSVRIKPPRVAESPVNYECTLKQVVQIGDGKPGAGWVMIGEVVHVHVADEVIEPNFRINIEALRPVARLAGYNYARVRDVFEMKRLPPQIPVKQT